MAGRRIDELYYDITARTGGFTRGLGNAQTAMGKFRKLLGGAGLTSGLVAFGAAAVAAGIKATKMAASLDSALREVSTLLPGTVDNISDLRSEIIALSEKVPETPELLTKGLYQVISAGITDTAEAMGVLAVAAKAATAGVTDTFTSVDAITTVLNAYQLETSEAQRVSDALFQTVKAGKTTFGELSANIGTVATSAALAGVSIEEVGAALATMTKFGISTGESSSALNRLLIGLTQITDDQAAAAKRLGVEYSLAAVKSKGLVGFLQDLERATGGNVEALAELNPNIRSARAAFVLAGKGAAEYGKILAETNNSAGATNEAFDKVNGSLENQSALLKNKINAAWLNLGANILPVVLETLETINRLLESDGETLARLYRSLGNEAGAAAVEAAEAQKRLVESIEDGNTKLKRALIERQRSLGEFRQARPGGPTTGQSAGQFADLGAVLSVQEQLQLIPDLAGKSAEAQEEILRVAIRHGEQLDKNRDLTVQQELQLQDILVLNTRLLSLLDQQGQRQETLAGPDEGTKALQDGIVLLKERASILAQAGPDAAKEVAEIRKQVALRENELALIAAESDLVEQQARARATTVLQAQERSNALTATAADLTGDARDKALEQAGAFRDTGNAIQRVNDLSAARAGIEKGIVVSIVAQNDALNDQQDRIDGLRTSLALLQERLSALAAPDLAGAGITEELRLEEQIEQAEKAIEFVKDFRQTVDDLFSGDFLDNAGLTAGLDTSGGFQLFDNVGAKAKLAQDGIEAALKASRNWRDQLAAVEAILKGIGVRAEDLSPAFRQSIEILRAKLAESGEAAAETDASIQEIVQDVSFAARSAVELAGAFGLVGEEAAGIVNQVALIGEGIGRIASGDILGGIAGAASGLAGIVSAVGGPSQSELERIESEKEIARRLRVLTNSVDVLISVMSQLPGQLTTDLKEALGTALAGITIQKDDDLPSLIENAKASDRIKAALAAAKVDIGDIQRLNADLGLPIDQLVRLLEGETLNAEQLIEALQQAQGLFDGITLEVQDMSKSVADALGFLQAGFDRFDVDEPLKQLDAISKKLGELGVNLTGEELKRLASGDEGLIEELLRQAIEGSGRFTTLDDFGKLNQEELIRFLDELERLGDRLESERADGGREGDFQQVSAQNRFTVEQADRGLAQDATRNALLERILEEIRGGVGLGALPVITDRTLAAAATIRVEHSGGFVVDVRGDAVDVQSAAVIRDGLVEHLSVDRYLGEQARNIRAGYGLPSRSVQ